MRQYAKLRGVTQAAVSVAVRQGRITCDRDERGYALIDPEVADKQWAENTDHSKFRNSGAENRISKLAEREEAESGGEEEGPNMGGPKKNKEDRKSTRL